MTDDAKFVQDYTMVCRTCLQSNVEMLSLNALITDIRVESSKYSYMDFLKKCIQVEELLDVQMPQLICFECASALQVSYWFMKNASQAQELLKLKLREIKRKQQIEMENAGENVIKTKRYRCKICNVKVETKRSLKDHVKLHLDIIVYSCQLCAYESHNRNNLCEHYTQIHCVEPTKEQLKPKTKLSSNSPSTFVAIAAEDGAIKNEHFQILPEEIPINSCNTESLEESGAIENNSNYSTISDYFNAMTGEPNNDLNNVANEYIVMADGSLKKVMNKDVVIEYINAQNNDSKPSLETGVVLNNLVQVQNIESTDILYPQNYIGQMDVDDLIIEDRGDFVEEPQESVLLPLEEERIPVTIIEQPKKIMCKICTKDFLTQQQLKNHMLTHNEIPHFFCDQCKFYTFFKIDLHQHYKSKHNLQPTNKQLQPKNKQKTILEYYACDFCFYEAEAMSDLKMHYKTKHNISSNDINIKLTKVVKLKASSSPLSAKSVSPLSNTTTAATRNLINRSFAQEPPDYPNGLNCRKCNELFYWRNKLYEHYKMHNAQEAALKQERQVLKIQNKPTSSNACQNKIKVIKKPPAQRAKVTNPKLETKNSANFPNSPALALNITKSNMTKLDSASPLTPSSSSTYTLPLDAVPQIVETDQAIENDMDVYFNCDDDALFQDFDDDVDVENDSDDNDSELRNVLLTSDDDFEDMMQNQNKVNTPCDSATTESYCAHCQKSFISQYQFENHMFVHRGLAPYRCELCTNLYNTKRCLIRHYKAVHKNIPTRDMIQAKGDKIFDEKTPIEHLKLETTAGLMCAKCPYETSDINNIKFHLNSSHNINDDSYIMRKLPFECPRCIRSFGNKVKLLRHLERNHSLTPINEHQVRFDGVEDDSTTKKNKTESNEESNVSCAYSDIPITQEQQHQQRCTSPSSSTEKSFAFEDAVAPNIIVAHFEECASETSRLLYNESSTNSNISITNMPSNSNVPIARTALDENDFDQPLFKCKVCFFTCYNLTSFNEHSKRLECRNISVNDPNNKVMFECEICHCTYKTIYLLKHHLKRHIGRKFLCVECPKTFINKMELEAHGHVHSGERPHKCDVCTKSFRYVHHLKRHKDSAHFGKRYACTEPNCERKFTTLAQLKVHIWSHNGIVPYKCPVCNRLFKKRLLLREHCSKIHKINLSEEEMAAIFRNSLGYTNPHDFTVTIGNGKMLRRGDLETMGAFGVINSSLK